jgi:hypothetical protein
MLYADQLVTGAARMSVWRSSSRLELNPCISGAVALRKYRRSYAKGCGNRYLCVATLPVAECAAVRHESGQEGIRDKTELVAYDLTCSSYALPSLRGTPLAERTSVSNIGGAVSLACVDTGTGPKSNDYETAIKGCVYIWPSCFNTKYGSDQAAARASVGNGLSLGYSWAL